MKNLKTFKSFVTSLNEKVNLDKAVRKLGYSGYNASFDGDVISVLSKENPWWGDDNVYTFYWDGKECWAEGAYNTYIYTEPCKTLDDFMLAMDDSENWEDE